MKNKWVRLKEYEEAIYHTGSELYELPNGVFLNRIEYETDLDRLTLEVQREIRKQERGFEYVDSDNNRFD
jgi:hypothetical protein